MSILDRFKEIMSSNLNAFLDGAEDPIKMIDQYLRNIEADLESVKDETANVMAEEKRIQRAIDEHNAQIEKLDDYASKTLQDDARAFISKKTAMVDELEGLKELYDNALLNTQNIKTMYDKLVKDIAELESQSPMLKAQFAQAKLQGSIAKMISGSISDDRATAMLELNKIEDSDPTDELIDKYDNCTINSDVENELARLKQNLNASSSNDISTMKIEPSNVDASTRASI